VHVALISQLVVPLITAAAAEDKASQLLTLEVCEALLMTAFRPQDTVLFGEYLMWLVVDSLGVWLTC
jgi:hypothetical protein